MGKNKANAKGFTLIELVVVIAIIGVLAAILVPSLMNYMRKARRAAAIQEVKQIINCTTATMADTLAEGNTLNLNKKFKTKDGRGEIKAGCLTNWSIANYVSNKNETDPGKLFDQRVAGAIIEALGDSIVGSMYTFSGSPRNPIGDGCKQFYKTYKCPGLIFCYDDKGAILMIDYYNHGVLVHYENGDYDVDFEDTAKFTGYDIITYP